MDKGLVKYEDNHTLFFTFPKIPQNITTPKDRAKYLVSNFWNNYNFADSSLVGNPSITEQGFTQFLGLLPLVSDSVANNALSSMILKARTDSYAYSSFMALSEIYLFDPKSPFKNDEEYLIILKDALSNKSLSQDEKIRPQRQYNMIMKNKVGEKATDFHFVNAENKESNLYSIKAPTLILFFNDPKCDECNTIKSHLCQSEIINDLMDKGKLKIFAMFPDNDIANWSKTEYPLFWINGYDANLEIEDKDLYDLHMPALYLLDVNKTILLKNTKIEDIEMVLFDRFITKNKSK